MAIDYSVFAIPKGTPRIVCKMNRRRDLERAERECRAKVDARDKRRCFFPACRAYATEKHHRKQRSMGGLWVTSNILSACSEHHRWFKAGLIRETGNPDCGPVKVFLTALGKEVGLYLPVRPGRGRP